MTGQSNLPRKASVAVQPNVEPQKMTRPTLSCLTWTVLSQPSDLSRSSSEPQASKYGQLEHLCRLRPALPPWHFRVRPCPSGVPCTHGSGLLRSPGPDNGTGSLSGDYCSRCSERANANNNPDAGSASGTRCAGDFHFS